MLPLEDRGLSCGGGGIGKLRDDFGLSALRRFEQDCNFRFWRSPEGVEPILPLVELIPLDDVRGEIMLETALVNRLVVGVLLKLNAFLTLCSDRA